jgi:hypothetical protein
MTSFKKELTDLKKKKTGLLQANTAAKAEVLVVEKEVGCHSKPIRKGLESILAKEWNIKRPSWHGGNSLDHYKVASKKLSKRRIRSPRYELSAV